VKARHTVQTPVFAVSSDRPALPWAGLFFPRRYAAFALVGVLDLLGTAWVLSRHGAEGNPIARLILDHTGFGGLILFKLALILLVIACCQKVTRLSRRIGRRLADAAVMISAVPVAVAAYYLTTYLFHYLSLV